MRDVFVHFLEESEHEGRQEYIFTLILCLFHHSIHEELRHPIHQALLRFRLMFELVIQAQTFLNERIHLYRLQSLLIILYVDCHIAIVRFPFLVPNHFIVRHIIEHLKE